MSLVARRQRVDAPDEPALHDEVSALSWAQLDAILNRGVGALLKAELGPDRRVAIFAENSIGTVLAYLTGVLAGCSGVPVNHHLRAEECAYILRDSGASLIFAGPENVDVAVEAARLAGGLPIVAWGTARPDVLAWEDFIAGGRDEEPPEDLRPLPYLHYTSGTTGFPKGVATPPGLYPGSEAATIREHVEALRAARWPGDGPYLAVAPLYHSGQLFAIKTALAAGQPLVVLSRFDAERTLAAIERHRVGRVNMVPTHLARLLALPDEVRGRYDVSSLQLVTHSAAACPIDVKYRMIDWLGPILWEGYGATEQGTVSSISSEDWLAHPGSVGRPREGLELYVIGEDGEELGPGRVGRLYVRDRSGFDVRFHNDEEKTASVHLRDGVFTLGEIGYVDDDGYLYLTDRFSDQVISGGVNIFPAEAERAMLALPGVADVACIGVPDRDLGEVLVALVVATDPHAGISGEELIERTQERLSKFKCPRAVEFVESLPRTPLGKLNKHELREAFLSGALAGRPG